MICSAPFALVFFFTQAALALPQAGTSNPNMSPSPSYSSTGTTSYSSTPTPYATTGSTPQYTSSPYASSSGCSCSPTPSAYPPMGKNATSSSYYTSSSCSCYSSTPYSSQPSYTSSSTYPSKESNYPPKESTYPPKESNYPPKESSYPPKESTYPPKESKPYTPPPYPSKGPEPPKTSPPTTPSTFRTTFDMTYDNKSGSMNNVACSNGANGLTARFPTFGDVPSFPFIGGAFDVVWNSPNCGSCWTLTNTVTGKSINIVAVDAAGAGFNIAQEAFVQLNGGQIGQGFLDVFATKVSPSVCGL